MQEIEWGRKDKFETDSESDLEKLQNFYELWNSIISEDFSETFRW